MVEEEAGRKEGRERGSERAGKRIGLLGSVKEIAERWKEERFCYAEDLVAECEAALRK